MKNTDKPLDEKLAMLDVNNYDFARDRQMIHDWKTRVPLLLAHREWQTHPVTVRIADDMKASVERINTILLSDEQISEEERRLFIREKRIIQGYLIIFSKDVSSEIEIIENGVNQEVE
jgi:hypothetical protein